MSPVIIIFSIVYLIVLGCYFYSETSGKFKLRVVNKIVMATMFLGYFLIASQQNGYWEDLRFIHCIVGFFFSWLGDVLLLFSFLYGGIAFMIGNTALTVYLSLECADAGLCFSDVWWVLPIFVVPASVFYVLHFTKKVDFKKIGILMPMYVTTVTAHGMLSVVTAANLGGAHYVVLACGLFLFMVSDYFLTTHKFILHKDWVLRCNSGTYFVGMLLAALSFGIK